MHKVLMNLLSNAIKYAGTPGKITVKIWTEDEKVFTSVADNGKGIEDNEKCKVFDAFYQIADEKSSYGSGIGLHIVKELLSLHHGDIHIEDNQPTGAKFIFYIPITPMEQIVETEFHIQPAEEEMVSLESEGKNENLDQNTLLIVEDNQDLRLFYPIL